MSLFDTDDIHPSDLGHDAIAAMLLSALTSGDVVPLIDFSPTTGPFDEPDWISLSDDGPHGCRVFAAEWVDGKQADLEDFGPGQATVVLSNDDRLFDPDYADGIYYGLLNPRVPFRIRAYYGGTTYDLFYGFVDTGWEQNYFPPEGATCTVKLVDMLAVLSGYTLRSVFEQAIVNLEPLAYWPLNEAAGALGVGDKVGNNDGVAVDEPGFGEPALFPGMGTSVLFDGDNDRIDISRSMLWEPGTDWSIVAAIRTPIPAEAGSEHPVFMQVRGNNSADIAALFVHTDGKIHLYDFVNGDGEAIASDVAVDDDDPHVIIGQFDHVGSEWGIGVDSATLVQDIVAGAGQSGNGVAIGGTPLAARGYDDNYFDGWIGHTAVWDSLLDSTGRAAIVAASGGLEGLRSDEHVEWALTAVGVPSTMYDLDQGVSIMGAASPAGLDALTFIRQVAATEQGGFYVAHHDGGKLKFRQRYASFQDVRSTVAQAAFSDDGTDADATHVERGSLVIEPNGVNGIINRVTVAWLGGEEIVDESAGSIYGPRSQSVTTQATAPAIARGIGQWIAALNPTPHTRVKELSVRPGGDQSVFPVALGTRIADLVSYRMLPQQVGDPIEKDLEVLGRRHSVAGRDWVTSFYLTESPSVGVDLFTLGTSELGGTHILAY